MSDSDADRPQIRDVIKASDRVLLTASLCAFVVWITTAGPVRWWADGSALRSAWVLGVAPNFFAGVTLTWWQAFVTGTGPLVSAACAMVLLVVGEGVQLAMSHQTADRWDIVASAAGAMAAVPAVLWRIHRTA